ncbi:MAG: RNase adapter RapZ [Elusimicrobia bacterium]|nr:RNase adapter RapZ [Elusimicrobiota bacterium]
MGAKTSLYIITGLSGAGKSQALKILEDLGFFCVDNIPVELVPRFADLCQQMRGKLEHVALGIDIRAGKSLEQLGAVLDDLTAKKILYKTLYFTANDETLLQRYSETRRRHPLGKRLLDAIRTERRMMDKVQTLSDQEIDTSFLTLGELKEILATELSISKTDAMTVAVMSFGYKYGLPIDADLVFDVRFLPNPNYVHELRALTGKNIPVKAYVQKQNLYKEFFQKISGLIDFLLPNYCTEGKSYLTIAVGCTGGRHRSVVVAEHLAGHIRANFPVQIFHRDVDRRRLPRSSPSNSGIIGNLRKLSSHKVSRPR